MGQGLADQSRLTELDGSTGQTNFHQAFLLYVRLYKNEEADDPKCLVILQKSA